MDVPDLIIPMRLDPAAATAQLKGVGTAGKKAGDDVASGAAKGNRGLKDLDGGAGSASKSLLGLARAQVGLSTFQSVATAIGKSFQETAQHVIATAKEFQKLRESMQGVASLMGESNTNKFTEKEISAARKANVTPQEYNQFRQAFLSKASLYVGEGPEAKLSTKDADEFQAALAEYAKQKGVSQAEMAGFGGGLLAQTKGKTTAAAMKARAGRVFATLEASSADVAHLLPMMTRTMAQGFSAEEAAPTLAMMPEIAPEEEGTYVLRAVAALREKLLDDTKAQKKGKAIEGVSAADIGLKKGQTPYQMLQAAVEGIKGRVAKGEDLDELLSEIAPEQISQKALRGMVDQGKEGFDRWRKLVEKTPADEMERVIKEGRNTEAGRQYAADAREAAEKARMGARSDPVARLRQIAETELTAGGAFEKFNLGAEVGAMAPGASDAKTIMINEQAIKRARAEVGESMGLGDKAKTINQKLTDDLLRELDKRRQLLPEEVRARNMERLGVRPVENNEPGKAGFEGIVRGRLSPIFTGEAAVPINRRLRVASGVREEGGVEAPMNDLRDAAREMKEAAAAQKEAGESIVRRLFKTVGSGEAAVPTRSLESPPAGGGGKRQ